MVDNQNSKIQKAKQIARRGDKEKEIGNYENALKCYESVRATLKLLSVSQQAKLPKNEQTIKNLCQKYDKLVKQMQNKIQQKKNNGQINLISNIKNFKFGFPTTTKPLITNNNSFKQLKKSPPTTNNSLQQPISEDINGLISKDIKVSFNDIIGLKDLKQTLYQAVIIPQKRPDLFQGIRSPPRGILLYGPPGNGKTFITQALAKQSGCTFYKLSAGSILNKFVGQSQKMLKKIFDSAKKTAPSLIFIDQIDSILTARSQSDNDAARRLKTQFLIQFDALQKCNVILIGATNLPKQLDVAGLRRFNKLVYVGPPDDQSRKGILEKALKGVKHDIKQKQLKKIAALLDGYSASQITDIVKQACMIPIRQISRNTIQNIDASQIRAVKLTDFQKVLKGKKPLLSKEQLKKKYPKEFK